MTAATQKGLMIGPLALAVPVVLAPMAGITNTAFRRLCREFGVGLYVWFGRDDPMAMACIQFVMKDEAKSIMMGAMPRAEAERMLADSLPLAKIERVGQIRHISPCPFGKGTAYHVVLMVPQDKVTLLVMPDTPMPAGRATHSGMHASVVPLRKGSVGIVGGSAAVVASVAGALLG